MKKWLIILCMLFLLVGCKPSEKLSIMVPQGSPAMTILGLDEDDYAIDIVNGPDPLVAAFGSMSHDAIIAPTNLGAKLYQSKEDYVLAGTVVWGNYHIISTNFESNSLSQLTDQTIIVFGQNQTSDIIIKHLLAQYHVNATITYVDSVQTAVSEYMLDHTKIVMVAEPSLSKVKALVPETTSIDLQTLYADLHDGASYPQASIFVKKDLSEQRVKHLMDDLRSSINSVNDKSHDLLTKGITLGILDDILILEDAIEGSHLMFQTAQEAKSSIEDYFSVILKLNSKLIGDALPNDSFYWSD